jgi:hypothetical protein
MNEELLQQLIANVKRSAEGQVKAIDALKAEVDAGNKQELIMDGIDILLDRERKGQNKKELDDVEDRISETNNILQNIQDGLAAWSQSWTDLFSSLKQTADDQLRISNQQLRLEDQSRVANEEARREAARADEASPNALIFQDALQQGKNERDEMPGSKMGGGSLFSMFSAIAAVGAVAKLFDVDEFMRIPAYLVTFSKQLGVLAKGFGTMIASLGKVGTFLSSIGSSVATFLKTSSTIAKILGPIGTVLGKLALPITIIMGILDGIGGFMKGYADTGSILTGIREAFVGIIDGLVGTLVRFAGEIIAFIPDIIGLDAVAETITDLFGGVVDGFMNMFRGVFDVVMGILTLDFGRLTDGLGNLLFGFADTIQELLFAPFNLAINFFRDIFGFSEEDAPPFRVQDVILDTINSIADWFTNLFDFDLPSFEDIRRNFLPSWLGGGPNQEELQAELDEANKVDKSLKNATSVSADFDPTNPEKYDENYFVGLTRVKRSGYDAESDQIVSDRLITNQGMELATPEQRAEMEKQSGARVATAQAALDSYTPFDPLGAIGSAVSDMGSRAMGAVSDFGGQAMAKGGEVFDSVSAGAARLGGQAMDLGGQALSYAGDKAGQAKDAVVAGVGAAADAAGEAFDAASEVVGNVVSDAITAVKDKAEALFDPIKNAFNSMIDTVKGIFDLSKIKMMLTNMFAEVGVPRVEFDVPLLGKIGFGPFYPFAPDAGSVQTNQQNSLEIGSEGKTQESRGSSIGAVGDRDEEEAEYGMTYDSSAATSLQETKQDGDLVTTRNTDVFAGFDYETGTGKVSLKSTDFLDNLATDEFREIENAVEDYNVGPLAFGKVRRMIDAGASAQDIRDFLKKNEETISDKVGGLLDKVGIGGLVDQASEVVGNVVEEADLSVLRDKAATGDISLEEFKKLRSTGQIFSEEVMAADREAQIGIGGALGNMGVDDVFDEDGNPTQEYTDMMGQSRSAIGRVGASLMNMFNPGAQEQLGKMQGQMGEVDSALEAITGEEVTVQGKTFKMNDKMRSVLEGIKVNLQDSMDTVQQLAGPSDEEAYADFQQLMGKDKLMVEGRDEFEDARDANEGFNMTIPEGVQGSSMLDQGIAAVSGFFSGRSPDLDPRMIEPTPSRALSAPVGQASQEVAAEKSSTNVIAPVSSSNANINNNTNNTYNTNTIAPSAGPRSSDPTFQRVQNNNFNGL